MIHVIVASFHYLSGHRGNIPCIYPTKGTTPPARETGSDAREILKNSRTPSMTQSIFGVHNIDVATTADDEQQRRCWLVNLSIV